MQKTIVPDLWTWKRWQPDRSMDFNSWFVKNLGANVVIDPLEPDADDVKQIEEMGGVAWVIVTNRDHERATKTFVERFGAKVAASDADAGELSVSVTDRLGDGALCQGWRVIALEGFKTGGEVALYSLERRTVILGDALWGDPAGSLRFGAEAKIDLSRAVLSIRRILGVPELDHLLVGDGVSIFGGARKAIVACIHARGLPAALRINIADVPTQLREYHNGYRAESGEIGYLLGAERLGYRMVRLEPGRQFCPSHSHTREEELFIVWEGTPTLVHPGGNLTLAKGDCVAFPCDEGGTHKVRNDGKSSCTILMVSNIDEGDVCFYPDSKKLMVERSGLIVRSEPALSYYDGE